jgi:ubiquinone/menaquinone biosynthesis C-methylase UbiE
MPRSTERFSSRVDNYVRYRPRYPRGVLETLQSGCGLTKTSVIADVGSGTGFLTELFLHHGNTVYGVEPNREMREAAEKLLKDYGQFRSVVGTAEETTLPDASIDFVTVGQAFHWFEQDKARKEFQRILKPQGWVVLVWNERKDSSPLDQAYEQLVRNYSDDYAEVHHKRIDNDVLRHFFGGDFEKKVLENSQKFDFEGLKGRLLSSSYSPEVGHPKHAPMLAELQSIFDAHQVNSQVKVEYDTRLYCGHLSQLPSNARKFTPLFSSNT